MRPRDFPSQRKPVKITNPACVPLLLGFQVRYRLHLRNRWGQQSMAPEIVDHVLGIGSLAVAAMAKNACIAISVRKANSKTESGREGTYGLSKQGREQRIIPTLKQIIGREQRIIPMLKQIIGW